MVEQGVFPDSLAINDHVGDESSSQKTASQCPIFVSSVPRPSLDIWLSIRLHR